MDIAEQNMASMAAGLSLTGKIPVINSFAVFSSGRAYDQIRQGICIPRLNVKICVSSSGLSDEGASPGTLIVNMSSISTVVTIEMDKKSKGKGLKDD